MLGEMQAKDLRRKQVMTPRSKVAHTVRAPEGVSRVGPKMEEGSKKAPTPEEIRQRAFEIHMQNGAIQGAPDKILKMQIAADVKS